EDPASLLSTFSYAYQLDASLYAKFLRRFSEANGVKRIEGRITSVDRDGESGHIQALILESGERIDGDFFIDCTGFRALLIGKELGAKFVDWSHWLPCDRAIAVACEKKGESLPYTRATAREAGWQWRIPLQHRTGNGHVYSSEFMENQAAEDILLSTLDAKAISEPNRLRFKAGMQDRQWIGNCIAVGLSSGFLEPLESTSIYLIQAGITAFAELMPAGGIDQRDVDEFNRVMQLEYDRIRDFLVLHYHATERDDSPFWNYVRTMSIPDTLKEKMDLFRSRGVVQEYKDGLFLHPSWIAVYLGQRVMPETRDPRVDALSKADLSKMMKETAEIERLLNDCPAHETALAEFCGQRAAAYS
ncbi:MAG: tryptophan 7-halogenase, partial [Henriciella sp.]